jgi:hypothetical protein
MTPNFVSRNVNEQRKHSMRLVGYWISGYTAYGNYTGRVPPKCRDVRFMSIGCRAG